LFERERQKDVRMPEGHEARFEKRLEERLGRSKGGSFQWIGIAAALIALLGLAFWMQDRGPHPADPAESLVQQAVDSTRAQQGISLGDLSPDLRKLENYYTASINMELATLDISEENKEVANDFILRLGELNSEYEQLNEELNEIGPNEQTIGAMIKNLQYRLQLMLKLKEKLIELKSSKNETVHSNSV
jgi:hypothetical protein